MSLLIRNATILTMNDAREIIAGDVFVEGSRIAALGKLAADIRADTTIDADGCLVVPGFIQTHIHLCQTLFRGAADDLPLLAWLHQRIWPLEAAHDRSTLAASARLAAAELLSGGTTSVLTMETVHETDAVFEALLPTGIRAVVGKCLMDERGTAPARLHQPAKEALDESLALHRRWHGAGNGRIHTALAPRFALSCTRDLLEATAAASASHGLLVHTHASEQRDEVNEVRARTGLANIHYLDAVGLATPRLRAAHCVWLTESEQRILAERSVGVLHCPGSNLKLGSGLAPVTELMARGVSVSLGADGAACNNSLDMFQEMRMAATLQAVKYGPGALPAFEAVRLATREGARALGLDALVGSIEIGKAADLCVLDTRGIHQQPVNDPYSLIVYATSRSDVRATIVDGHICYRNGQLAWGEAREIGETARTARAALERRAGLA